MKMNKVTIIGTGPAGLTAGIYAARAGLEPTIYAGIQHGGQLTTTTEVENFPGFSNGIMGPELMTQMTAQAERVGAKIIYENISKVDFSTYPYRLWSDSGEVKTKSVIIATGATAKTLKLEHEEKLMGRGISTCATCDGFFYKGKKVAIVGGGDSAMEEALYLANLCEKVILIHRRDVFKASKIMLARAQKHPNISFLVPYTIKETLFDKSGLTGIKIENLSNSSIEEMKIDGLFYAIGHSPNSEIFADFLELDAHGYIKVKDHTKTNIPGVFGAGDIADPTFKQAITAAGMGCQAAIQVAKFLEEKEHSGDET
jgi:thioredoxin reductase (NADPH)